MSYLPTIAELIDEAKFKAKIKSDYALAKLLDVSLATPRNWKIGFSMPDDLSSLKLAQLCDLEPAYVLALVQANRQKYSSAAHVWLQIFETVYWRVCADNGKRVL